MKCPSAGSVMTPRHFSPLRVSSRPPALKVISQGASLRTLTRSEPLVSVAVSASRPTWTAGCSSRTSNAGAAGTDPARCTARTRITSAIGEETSTRSTGPSMVLPRRVIGLVGARMRRESAAAVTSKAALAYAPRVPGRIRQ